MAGLRVGRRSFTRKYADRTRSLLKMAASLPDRPSPDEIHDLRVAARRIQMMRRLMPKNIRNSQDWKRFDFALRSVLKDTSQLRDMDTLMATLESHKGGLPSELLVSLENRRSDAAARAKGAVTVLAEAKAPELDASRVKGKRLSRRLRKRVRKHSKAGRARLAEVLSDESKAEELHSLRKEIKKMRYLIELADKPPAGFTSLVKWQESLGAIHDLDVAISYLRAADAGSSALVLELQRARHSNFLRFIRGYGTDQMQALGDGGAVPLGARAPSDFTPAEA